MIEILSTKELHITQRNILQEAGIVCHEHNFIQIEPIDFKPVPTIENAIFTSQNAVRSILDKNIQITNCFCVGDKTEALLKHHNFNVVEKAYQASTLAKNIVTKYKERSFELFCGNLRREELPALLKKHQVELHETQVYQTKLTSKNMLGSFDAILFFSPSAVESFAQRNLFDNTIVFCLGKTTEAEVRKHTNNLITANRTTIENVLVQVIKHFNGL
ncbi:uroporphyrinogen-III synthase [Galbibacter marinus]|uniref:Uroporphyrinogen-III synthase n=1 Tax=Galbibacter marinus TaxID=555500 RepID=K2PYY3_9FLAO|nr:uroporphyrinogen-III synthase [Galbibacter marinus]EKF56669.1 uroporphyrinogen-III synthase [Galbibacter marinus]